MPYIFDVKIIALLMIPTVTVVITAGLVSLVCHAKNKIDKCA